MRGRVTLKTLGKQKPKLRDLKFMAALGTGELQRLPPHLGLLL